VDNFCCKKGNLRKVFVLPQGRVGGDKNMNAPRKPILKQLADFPPETFENWFSRMVARLGLGRRLDDYELHCLFEAAFAGRLCNVAFNGLGGCNGAIRPERERNRISLEQAFMTARAQLRDCEGWTQLRTSRRAEAERVLLTVRVAEENLAPEASSPG
jgi:hypothetical protein